MDCEPEAEGQLQPLVLYIVFDFVIRVKHLLEPLLPPLVVLLLLEVPAVEVPLTTGRSLEGWGHVV